MPLIGAGMSEIHALLSELPVRNRKHSLASFYARSSSSLSKQALACSSPAA